MPFDIGFFELLLIFILALAVLGPERMPKAMQAVGRWVGKAKRTMSQFSQQVNRELELDELKKRVAEHEALIKQQAEGTELQALRDEAEKTMKQAESNLAKTATTDSAESLSETPKN